MSNDVDLDKLPFIEYARIMAEQGAAEHSIPDRLKLSFDQLVASEMNYFEIEEQYGEETAINVGIERDPDTFELDEEWFKRARPLKEVDPQLAAELERNGGRLKLAKWEVTLQLDFDVINHFKATGPDWHSHVNAILRQAAFGPQKAD